MLFADANENTFKMINMKAEGITLQQVRHWTICFCTLCPLKNSCYAPVFSALCDLLSSRPSCFIFYFTWFQVVKAERVCCMYIMWNWDNFNSVLFSLFLTEVILKEFKVNKWGQHMGQQLQTWVSQFRTCFHRLSCVRAPAVSPNGRVFHQEHQRAVPVDTTAAQHPAVTLVSRLCFHCTFKLREGWGRALPPPPRTQPRNQLVSISITLLGNEKTGSCGQTHE